MAYSDYEIVIGLEVHSELKTKTKIFCGCTTEFGGDPNTHCCPICTGMPGTLPVLNGQVVDYAIKAGLATNCKINQYSKQDRKNYFYPDLPKAYQVSQFDLPLCYEGFVDIDLNGVEKRIRITRIHIEEDAGKLIHDSGEGSLIDYNRCGVPLIEIVTEPDLRSPEEVKIFMEKLRSILLYADVTDGRMNEGSLRCDVNLSVRLKGAKEYGTRTEMKNINSFAFAVKAAEYEAKRQIKAIESGQKIIQETRRWDEAKGMTVSMRSKEEAHDYRYFPEPDLMPIVTSDERLAQLKESLPEMPDSRMKTYMERFGITLYDGELLVASRRIADFYYEAASHSKNGKLVANWIISEVFGRLSEDDKESCNIPFTPGHLAELVNLIEDNVISNSIAKTVFAHMWDTQKMPSVIVEEQGLKQMDNDDELVGMVKEAIAKNEKAVKDFLSGKEMAVQAIVGYVMKLTKGKANPKKVVEMIKSELNQ